MLSEAVFQAGAKDLASGVARAFRTRSLAPLAKTRVIGMTHSTGVSNRATAPARLPSCLNLLILLSLSAFSGCPPGPGQDLNPAIIPETTL